MESRLAMSIAGKAEPSAVDVAQEYMVGLRPLRDMEASYANASIEPD